MDFDPDAYLAAHDGAAAVATAPAPAGGGFDPDAYLKENDPQQFNPNQFLAANTTPAQRMQDLAPVVSAPMAKPEDDAAYVQAYKDYYNQNGVISRLGQTAAAVTSPGMLQATGAALWNMAKAGVAYGKEMANSIPLAGYNSEGDADPGPVADATALGKGLLNTAGKMGVGAIGLLGAAGDQIDNALADASGNQEFRDRAASDALSRLKMEGASNRAMGNDYAPGTPQSGYYQLGQAGANLAPVPGLDAAGAGNLIKAGGDVLGKLGAEVVGRTAQAGMRFMPATLLVAKDATIAGAAALASKVVPSGIHEMVDAGIGNYLGKIFGGPSLSPGTVSFSNLFRGGPVTKGLFQGAANFGEQVATTPLGQSVFDSLAQNAPQVLADSTNLTKQARYELGAAKSAYNQAYRRGVATSSFEKQIAAAQKAVTVAEGNQWLIQKGTGLAQWLQSQGASGVSTRMANAASGVILGGAAGGTIAGLQSQPGDYSSIAPGAGLGASYGLILSQFGAAATRAGHQPNPPLGPTGTPGSPGGGAPAAPASAGPSALRQAAQQSATNGFTVPIPQQGVAAGPSLLRPDSIMLDGIPHPADAVADALQLQGQTLAQTVREEAPLSETFDYKKITRELGKFGEPSAAVSDQQINRLVSLHQPVTSSAIPSAGYDPEQQMASVRFAKTPDKYHHYVFTEMPPSEWASFMNGEGFNGSVGQYFNRVLRNEFPYFEVQEHLFGQENLPASEHTIGNPSPNN